MNLICDIEHCTGCGACAAVCAHEAISMIADANGYLRPRIDQARCVDCGLCRMICPALHRPEMEEPMEARALGAKDAERRRLSSSGGAATLISEAFVRQGGVVYACVQQGEEICHVRIDRVDAVENIRGSKYVQSDTKDTYRECLSDLRAGRKVLYIGTPCQIAGLNAFLRKDYEGLITIDLVCHGVPSLKMLHDNVACVGADPAMAVSFRRKEGGRVKFGFYLSDGNRDVYAKDYPDDYYISGFLKGIFFRPNCFACRYACPERCSDITIGDFWGLGKYSPTKMDASKGVSLVLINTEKGRALTDMIADSVEMETRPVREAVDGNGQLRHAFRKPADYDAFQSAYSEKGYAEACREHLTAYIRQNRMTMLCERHPILMLPYRILAKFGMRL